MKLLICFLLLFSVLVHAEPAPRGIIYHDSSCAAYWQGDECTHYPVPDGWTAIYPFYKCGKGKRQETCYKYKGKTCSGDEKICCAKFGFNLVKIKQEPTHNDKLPFCNKNSL